MTIKIDQSGKIENTNINTVIAYSDGKKKSILLPARDKREIQKIFREAGKPLLFVYKTFAILIFLLIMDNLRIIDEVIIDNEYPGWGFQIKDFLLREIREKRSFSKEYIYFKSIGKKSPAHSLAYNVYKRKVDPDKIVNFNDIAKFLL